MTDASNEQPPVAVLPYESTQRCSYCDRDVAWTVDCDSDGWKALHYCHDRGGNHSLIEISTDNEGTLHFMLKGGKRAMS